MADGAPSNALIALLPAEERERMRSHLEEPDASVRYEVFRAARPPAPVYFPLSCVVSVRTRTQDGVAAGVIAREYARLFDFGGRAQ